MAIVMRMSWRGVTPEQYEEVRRLSGQPLSDTHHSSLDADGTWRWTATWADKDAAEAFVCQQLLPAVTMVRLRGGPDIAFEPTAGIPAQRVDQVSVASG